VRNDDDASGADACIRVEEIPQRESSSTVAGPDGRGGGASKSAGLKKELPPKGISSFIEKAVRARIRPDRRTLDQAYRAASKETWRRTLEREWRATETEGWPE